MPGGPGVRVDTAAYRDYVVPPNYDSMIAKIVVHASSRYGIARMKRALEATIIEGIKTTIPAQLQFFRIRNSRPASIRQSSWNGSKIQTALTARLERSIHLVAELVLPSGLTIILIDMISEVAQTFSLCW